MKQPGTSVIVLVPCLSLFLVLELVKSVLTTGHWPLELTTDHQATNFDHQTTSAELEFLAQTPEQPQ